MDCPSVGCGATVQRVANGGHNRVAEPLDLRTGVGGRDAGHVHPQVQRVGAGSRAASASRAATSAPSGAVTCSLAPQFAAAPAGA